MRFATKGIYITNGIKFSIDENEISASWIQQCIAKHFNNQGEECKKDNKANETAIKRKDGRVFSVFNKDNNKIYIITDGLHLAEEYAEYPMTTVMFPEEY